MITITKGHHSNLSIKLYLTYWCLPARPCTWGSEGYSNPLDEFEIQKPPGQSGQIKFWGLSRWPGIPFLWTGPVRAYWVLRAFFRTLRILTLTTPLYNIRLCIPKLLLFKPVFLFLLAMFDYSSHRYFWILWVAVILQINEALNTSCCWSMHNSDAKQLWEAHPALIITR